MTSGSGNEYRWGRTDIPTCHPDRVTPQGGTSGGILCVRLTRRLNLKEGTPEGIKKEVGGNYPVHPAKKPRRAWLSALIATSP